MIGFSVPKKDSILSALIRGIECTKFSHVFIKVYDPIVHRWVVYHASGTKVNFIGLDKFYLTNKDVEFYNIPVTSEQRVRLLQRAIDTIGTPYGIMQLIGLGFVRLCRAFGLRIKNPFASGKKTYICTEVVGETLQDLNIISKSVDLDRIGLKEIQTYLKEYQNGKNSAGKA